MGAVSQALDRPRHARTRAVVLRSVIVMGLVVLGGIIPLRPQATYASASSMLATTTSGIHLGMVFNNYESTVNGYKTGEGNVDYVWGADSGMHNMPASSGAVAHDYYLTWNRDQANGAMQPLSWYKTNHPDWILYKADQTTVPIAFGDNLAPLDFTNPAVQQYMMSTWTNPAIAGGFTGIGFDNDLGINYLNAAGHYSTSGTWVPLYSGASYDQTYANAQATAFQQIVNAVHSAHPSVTVGVNQGNDCTLTQSIMTAGSQYADDTTDEMGFTDGNSYITQNGNSYCPSGEWLGVAQWDQHLGRDLGEGLFIVNQETYPITAYLTDTNSQARFDLQWNLANYLLVKYSHTYFWWGQSQVYGYTPVPQHEITTAGAIGSPTDDFYVSQSVYMRDFTGGLSVVNPSASTSYTVTLPAGKYQDLYGNPITSDTMPPHSGLVLLLVGGTPTPTATTSSGTTLAVEGTNQDLWVKHGTGSWTGLGGILTGAPAVVAMPGGAALYIVAGSDHTLWERTDTTGWQLLSNATCLDNPTATVVGTLMTVACTGSDHSLHYGQATLSGNTPPAAVASLTSLGGSSNYGPAVSVVNGSLTFFVIGTDGQIWWRTVIQGWSAMSGTGCTGHPAASTYGTTSYLACHGSGDNAVWYSKNSGSGWSSWASLGGSVVDGPGLAATSSGTTFVIQGGSNVVYQNVLSTNGSTTGWQSNGGYCVHGAAAGAA